MNIKNIIILSFILVICFVVWKNYNFKKGDTFTDKSVSYYSKKLDPSINYSTKCHSINQDKDEKYIWKDEWQNDPQYTKNKKFKDTKFIINKEKVKNCSKNCINSNNCKGFSIKFRKGIPIRCILHNSDICENKHCYKESFICVKKKNNSRNNILCNSDCENTIDKGDEKDTPEHIFNTIDNRTIIKV